MAEYIEREALLERLKFKRNCDRLTGKRYAGLESAIAQVKKAHAADVVEVRHGEWEKVGAIFFDNEVVYYRCPLCNTTWESKTKYCPNCGAKMDGKGEGE